MKDSIVVPIGLGAINSNSLIVNKLYKDWNGNYWVLSQNDTLIVLDKSLGVKKMIILPRKEVTCKAGIQVEQNEILIASSHGIIRISFSDSTYQQYKIAYFDRANGLLSSDVFDCVSFKGKIVVSTAKGLCVFDKPEQLAYSSQPNTVIGSFFVNDQKQKIKDSGLFSYKQNNISFQVDALTFKKIGQRGFFYKYLLQGWDKEFKTATDNTVSYSNLPLGDYTFIAKSYYDDETQDPTPATFSFTIKPAFWQTWWALH